MGALFSFQLRLRICGPVLCQRYVTTCWRDDRLESVARSEEVLVFRRVRDPRAGPTCLHLSAGDSDKLTCSLTFPNAASYFPARHWIIIVVRGSARLPFGAIDCDQTRATST